MNTKSFYSRLAALTLVALSLSTTAAAQVRGRQTYDIPFGFVVGKTFCPAGRYTVTEQSTGVLRIDKEGAAKSVMFLARLEQGNGTPHRSSLVFRRYGDTRFLSQIHSAWEPGYAQLNRSHAEQDVARRTSQSGQPIVVLARPEE